jgi:glycosyltransferase involved in cell wall biosynthesis
VTALSAYILTFNSEPHLAEILRRLAGTADELLVVDSGSTDRTLAIAREHGCRVVHRPLTDFREQRSFAQAECAHDMVLFVDSDELPSDELVEAIASLKASGFGEDAYEVRREWYAFGRKVRAVYPVVSPDYPIRILDRRKVSFDERSRRVHETPFGHSSLGRIEAALHHHTFGSKEELERKLARYTDIAAAELRERGGNAGPMKELANPVVAFLLWYCWKGGWRDGALGLTLSRYAFRYTRLKYRKARLSSEARDGGS